MKTSATTTTRPLTLRDLQTAVDRMRARGLVVGTGRGLYLTLHGQAHAAARARPASQAHSHADPDLLATPDQHPRTSALELRSGALVV